MSSTAAGGQGNMPLPTADEATDPTTIALSTLSLLDLRLARLEHLVRGASHVSSEDVALYGTPGNSSATVQTQLRSLESRLLNLKRLDGLPGSLVRMIDSLRREFPELFQSIVGAARVAEHEPHPASRDLSGHATQVLSHAALYTSTSSRLQTLQTMRIPPAAQSAHLIDALPRLEELRSKQVELNAEVEELRYRSARIFQWWTKMGVVGTGELFEDWEERLQAAESQIRRYERKQAEERGDIG